MSMEDLSSGYRKLVEGFKQAGEMEKSVFIYSIALAKKVRDLLKTRYRFKEGEFLLVYAGVLFLSIKMANDLEIWHVEDFAKATRLEEDIIQEMELFVFEEILNFRALVPQEAFKSEVSALLKKYEY